MASVARTQRRHLPNAPRHVPRNLPPSPPGASQEEVVQARDAGNYSAAHGSKSLKTTIRQVSGGAWNPLGYEGWGGAGTDATAALNWALEEASNNDGFVYLTEPDHLVNINPVTGQALTYWANTRIKAAARGTSTIKLASGQPSSYLAVLGPPDDTTETNLSIEGVTFDGNTAGNPVNWGSAPLTKQAGGNPRYTVWVRRGRGVRLNACHFTDQISTNVVVIRGVDEDLAEAWIERCVFDEIGGTTQDYDHSCIYTEARRVWIQNNILRGKAVGGYGSRTAIETHGSHHNVDFNEILAFQAGIIATGSATESEQNSWIGNKIWRSLLGIRIYSWSDAVMTEPMLRDAIFAGNEIVLDRDGWFTNFGATTIGGIRFENNTTGTYNAPKRNIKIHDNIVRFVGTTNYVGGSVDERAAGILLRITDATVNHKRIEVYRNAITGSIGPGIYADLTAQGLVIDENIITNPGKGTLNGADFRAAIRVQGNQTAASVSRNKFLDDNTTARTIQYGVYAATSAATECKAEDNDIWIADGTSVPLFYNANATSQFFIRQQEKSSTLPLNAVAFGSEIIDRTAGTLKRQRTAPSGTNWVAE